MMQALLDPTVIAAILIVTAVTFFAFCAFALGKAADTSELHEGEE